jgi:hypothetical protein
MEQVILEHLGVFNELSLNGMKPITKGMKPIMKGMKPVAQVMKLSANEIWRIMKKGKCAGKGIMQFLK